MKIANKIVLALILITISSCNKKDMSIQNFDSKFNTSYVNFDADSVYYELNVGSENNDYFHDEKSNLLFLVTREVYVKDKNFGGYNQDWSKAENYSKKIDENAYLVTKISIKKKNNNYETVWKFDNQINFYDNSYGLHTFKLFLEESYAKYNGKVQNRLHINFKTVDYDDGYKLSTLNYVYENKNWQLVSRESICTIPNDINHEELGYCIDTINYKCKKGGNKFDLTYEDIFNLSSGICNGRL